MKIMDQLHRKVCKLNFHWNICSNFFQAPPTRVKKFKGPLFASDPPHKCLWTVPEVSLTYIKQLFSINLFAEFDTMRVLCQIWQYTSIANDRPNFHIHLHHKIWKTPPVCFWALMSTKQNIFWTFNDPKKLDLRSWLRVRLTKLWIQMHHICNMWGIMTITCFFAKPNDPQNGTTVVTPV